MAFPKKINDRLKSSDYVEATFTSSEPKDTKMNKANRPYYIWEFNDVEGEDNVSCLAFNDNTNQKFLQYAKEGVRVCITRDGDWDLGIELVTGERKEAEEFFGGTEEKKAATKPKKTGGSDFRSPEQIIRTYAVDFTTRLVAEGSVKIKGMEDMWNTIETYISVGAMRDVESDPEETFPREKVGYPADVQMVSGLLEDLRAYTTDDMGKTNAKMGKRWVEARLKEFNADELPWDIAPKDLKEEVEKLDQAEIEYMIEQIKDYI